MADDFSHDPTTRGVVFVGGDAAGVFELPGDNDWFRVTLQAGVTYFFEGHPGGVNEPGYRYGVNLGLRDAAGWEVDRHGFRPVVDLSGNYRQMYFTPTETGTYYVVAGTHPDSGIEAYTVAVSTPVDDYVANTQTKGNAPIGTQVTGRIERATDQDWFRVSLDAGTTYHFDLNAAEGAAAQDMFMSLYAVDASSGVTQLAGDPDPSNGGQPLVHFTPTISGTYYLGVYERYRQGIGDYALRITESADDEFAGNVTTTGTIAPGGEIIGELERANDQDWVKVTLESGKTYVFDLRGVLGGGGTVSPYGEAALTLYDAAGTALARGTAVEKAADPWARGDPLLYFTPTSSGNYFLGVDADGGVFSDSTGSYTLRADVHSDDYGAVAIDRLVVGSQVAGVIEVDSDADWFKVSVQPGTAYSISLAGTQATLRLKGELGSEYQNVEAVKDYFVPQAQTIYVGVGERYGAVTGAYTLKLALSPFDDYSANTATRGVAILGGYTQGRSDMAFDSDWFRVTLEKGTTYQFALLNVLNGGSTLGLDSPPEGAIRIFDASGNAVQANNSLNQPAFKYFTPATSGTYYIGVGFDYGTGHSHDEKYQAISYTLHTEISALDDYAANAAHDGALAVNGQTTGNIEFYRDEDWFEITLQAGTVYAFDLRSSTNGGGTLSEQPSNYIDRIATMSLYDSEGSVLKQVLHNEERFPILYFQPETSGSYHVGVRGEDSALGTYTIRAATIADDYAEGLTTTGAIEVGEQITGRIESPGDNDWFNVALQAGITYRFDLLGTKGGGGTLGQGTESIPYLTLYDPEGAFMRAEFAGGIGDDPLLYYTPIRSGTYHLGINELFDSGLGTYTLGVMPSAVVDDFNGDVLSSGTVAAGERITGQLQFAGDEDWFAVSLHAGVTYSVSLADAVGDGGTAGSRSRAKAFVNLYDSSGDFIASTANGSTNGEPLLFFTPTESGIYYVAANEMFHAQTWTYALEVDQRAGADAKRITGTAGDDLLNVAWGDQVDGGDGIDTIQLAGWRFQLPISQPDAANVRTVWTSGPHKLMLSAVERLHFTDMKVALDIDANAGVVAKTIGAVLGAAAVANPRYARIGLEFIDQIGATGEGLMEMALNAVLGPDASDGQVVDLLYTNVAGYAPAPAAHDYYVDLLESGAYSRAALGLYAAEHGLNLVNIDLVGLSIWGLVYENM